MEGTTSNLSLSEKYTYCQIKRCIPKLEKK